MRHGEGLEDSCSGSLPAPLTALLRLGAVPGGPDEQDERDGTEAQRAAMVAYTRALIRQGGPENPWEGLATRQRRRGCWRLWKQAEQRPEMRRFASRRQRALISDRWTRVGFAVFARGACTGHGILGPS